MRSSWFWHGQVSSKGTVMGSLCAGNAGRCEPVLLKLPWLSHGPDSKRWSTRPGFPFEILRGPRFGMQIKEQGAFLSGAYSRTSLTEK